MPVLDMKVKPETVQILVAEPKPPENLLDLIVADMEAPVAPKPAGGPVPTFTQIDFSQYRGVSIRLDVVGLNPYADMVVFDEDAGTTETPSKSYAKEQRERRTGVDALRASTADREAAYREKLRRLGKLDDKGEPSTNNSSGGRNYNFAKTISNWLTEGTESAPESRDLSREQLAAYADAVVASERGGFGFNERYFRSKLPTPIPSDERHVMPNGARMLLLLCGECRRPGCRFSKWIEA